MRPALNQKNFFNIKGFNTLRDSSNYIFFYFPPEPVTSGLFHPFLPFFPEGSMLPQPIWWFQCSSFFFVRLLFLFYYFVTCVTGCLGHGTSTVLGSLQPAAWHKKLSWQGQAPLGGAPSCLPLPSSAASVREAADRLRSLASFELGKNKQGQWLEGKWLHVIKRPQRSYCVTRTMSQKMKSAVSW